MWTEISVPESETPLVPGQKDGQLPHPIPTRSSLYNCNSPTALPAPARLSRVPVCGAPAVPGLGSRVPAAPQGAPAAQPPGPSRPAEAPSYLSASSAAGVAGSPAALGQGWGAGGGGAGLGGSGRARAGEAGTVPGGQRGGRWHPQGLRAGPAEPEEVSYAGIRGGAPGPGPGVEGFPPRAGGALQPSGPARSPARRREGGHAPGKQRTGRADQRGCVVASADKSIRARGAGGPPPSLRRPRLPGWPRAAS